MFFETHKMMSHLLRCHRGDLISVGPIVSLSPTQGVFLTRSSNPPSCQRQECGRLPLYSSTRSCMQIYIAPPAAGPVWPNVQSGMLPGLLYKVPNPICLGNLFLSNGDPAMPWPGLPGIVIGWGTENISATLLPIWKAAQRECLFQDDQSRCWQILLQRNSTHHDDQLCLVFPVRIQSHQIPLTMIHNTEGWRYKTPNHQIAQVTSKALCW